MVSMYKDKVIILTGGSNGIGAAILKLFEEAEAIVAVLDIADIEASTSSRRINIKCDVSSEESVESAVKQVVEKWKTVDILINCAGITDGFDRVGETSNAMWTRVLGINLNGPFFLMRACIPHFLANTSERKGSIVNVCSVASIRGAMAGAPYTASKHALLGLTRNTSWMYAKEGITCNAVIPGAVETQIMENSRVEMNQVGYEMLKPVHGTMPGTCKPEDIAKAVFFLAGAVSVNGAELVVDKGWMGI